MSKRMEIMNNVKSIHAKQSGVSLIVVLVLLAVMLLGVTSIARLGEAYALVAGNVASKDSALQASEVGVSDAYAAIQALSTPDTADPAWYIPTYTKAGDDANGLPKAVNWTSSALNKKTVGGYTVRYVVERFCTVVPVTDINNQCMVKLAYAGDSAKAGVELIQSPPGIQYRITVHVTGPKDLSSFVQALVVWS